MYGPLENLVNLYLAIDRFISHLCILLMCNRVRILNPFFDSSENHTCFMDEHECH